MVIFLRLAYFRFVTGNNHCELRSSFPSLDPQVRIQKAPFTRFSIIHNYSSGYWSNNIHLASRDPGKQKLGNGRIFERMDRSL